MSGMVILLIILILLACYGFYTISHLILRRFLPDKTDLNLYISLGAAFCFLIAAGFSTASATVEVRSRYFAQGYADAAAELENTDNTMTEAQIYSNAYTQGYTDAIDAYIDRILAPALADRLTPSDQGETENERTASDPDASDPQHTIGTENIDTPAQDTNESTDSSTAPVTGTTVYYTKSGSVLHFNRNCSYLKNASEILSCDLSDAPNRPYCSRCG